MLEMLAGALPGFSTSISVCIMQHKWLLVLVILCSVFLTELGAASDDTKDQITEKRKAIKGLISKIRTRLDKKQKSGKMSVDKSGKMMAAAQTECAASKIKGVETCCPNLNKTLFMALDVDACAVDLAAFLELGRNEPLPPIYQQYTLHLLQDLDTNKLTFANVDKNTKEQICVSECLIRKLRSNSRQMKGTKIVKKLKTQSSAELFKDAFDGCRKYAKGFTSTSVSSGTKTCAVAPYLQLQCTIRKLTLNCDNLYIKDELCQFQKEQLQLCDAFKF